MRNEGELSRYYKNQLASDPDPSRFWFQDEHMFEKLTIAEFQAIAESHNILSQITWKFFDKNNIIQHEFGPTKRNYVMSFKAFDGHIEPLNNDMQVRNKNITLRQNKAYQKDQRVKVSLDNGDIKTKSKNLLCYSK